MWLTTVEGWWPYTLRQGWELGPGAEYGSELWKAGSWPGRGRLFPQQEGHYRGC